MVEINDRPGDLRPCAHCERELPVASFRSPHGTNSCRECDAELRLIRARKFRKLDGALARARERQRLQEAGRGR